MLSNLGSVAYEQGDYAGPHAKHMERLEIRRLAGDRRGIAHDLEGLAAVATAQGRPEQGARFGRGADDSIRVLSRGEYQGWA